MIDIKIVAAGFMTLSCLKRLIYFAGGAGDPECVVVLTDIELVAIDLTSDGWPLHRTPYLDGLNASSPITCVEHVAGVSDTVWTNVEAAGNADIGQWSTKVARHHKHLHFTDDTIICLSVNEINQELGVHFSYIF